MYVISGMKRGAWDIKFNKQTLEHTDGTKSIHLDQNVANVELISQSKKGGLNKTAAGAVIGFLAAGPLGTAIGAGLGAGAGRDESIAVVALFSGEAFEASVSTKEYNFLKRMQVSSTVPRMQQTEKVDKPQAKEANKKEEENIYSKIPPMIKGRKGKSIELPELELLNKWKALAKENGPEAVELIASTENTLRELNIFKWRYFDQTINTETEQIECLERSISIIGGQEYDRKRNLSNLKEETKETHDKLSTGNAELEQLIDTRKKMENDLKKASFFTKSKKQQELQLTNNKIQDLEDSLRKLDNIEQLENQISYYDKEVFIDVYEAKINFFVSILGDDKLEQLLQNLISVEQISKAQAWRIIKRSKSLKRLEGCSKEKTIEDRLKKLSELKKNELIDDKEYQEQRAAIISLI